ncbi:MAG TPA: UPF0182 family protein [Coriobacteriia bacterium]|nr:UPF0182 family protein [Coriobacteriia bacterium]
MSFRSLATGIVGVFAALGLALAAVVVASYIWTEYAWFKSMKLTSVFMIRLMSQGGFWLIGTAIAFVALFAAATVARKLVGGPKLVGRIALWGSLVLATLVSWDLAQHWMQLRLAVSGPAFGMNDPLFGRDIGFFIFSLPALEVLARWASDVIVLAIVFVLGIVFVPTLFDIGGSMEGKWWRFKSLASVLTGIVLVSSSFGLFVSLFKIVLSSRTSYFGAAYTDTHAQLPANIIILAMTLLVAVVFFATAKSKNLKIPGYAFVAWIVVASIAGGLWPSVVQNYVVKPNEATLELPYISRNIAMTRTAFDLETVKGEQYAVESAVASGNAEAAAATLSNARIWAPSTAASAYDQLQTIRPYYRMSAIDIDRYIVNGQPEQALAAARLVDASRLPKPARTWVNKHLVYTHGYGAAISSANDATSQGFPHFLVGEVPPKVADTVAAKSPELKISEPRVYYGEGAKDYAIVNTSLDEFDHPVGEKNVTTRYEAQAGVPFGNALARIAWAIRFGSDQIVFSDYLKSDSRVLMYRDVKQRAKRIAPWLSYDKKPYAAVVDGRIVWILDAYTSSKHFPYSQPLDDGTNYLRNSVKVVVDAYTGDTHFYAVGDDPVRDAWAKIYPEVLTPAAEVPASFAAHFRAPRKLFTAQAKVYRTYHMTDPTVFYNKEDVWSVPDGLDGEASYLMLDLADSTPGPNLYLMQPFTPVGRDNLIGWMATACDPADYGKRTVFMLPKERVTLGPTQARARINQDPQISPQLSLWDQRGSKVIFGQMLVLPSENTITYVQPIFLQAAKSAPTELARVVVMNGDHVEMAETLPAALDKAFGVKTVDATRPDGAQTAASQAKIDEVDAEIETLVESLNAAKARGDMTTYGVLLTEIERAIQQRAALTGQAAGQ